MQNIRNITDKILWVGASDRRLHLFENMFPIPDGVAYNSYVILDEKTAIMDTADSSVTRQYLENLTAAPDCAADPRSAWPVPGGRSHPGSAGHDPRPGCAAHPVHPDHTDRPGQVTPISRIQTASGARRGLFLRPGVPPVPPGAQCGAFPAPDTPIARRSPMA